MKLNKYYEILKINPNSTPSEVKSQYRKLSFNLHPDRNDNLSCQEEFKKITNAYKIISESFDSEEKNQLILKPELIDEKSLNSFANIIINKLNGTNSFAIDDKPQTIYREITIDILSAYKGVKYPLDILKYTVEFNIKKEIKETIYIDIPEGIDNNEIIYIKDKGNKNSSNNLGDIEVKIIVRNDSEFIRQGLDLLLNKQITLKQALCGFEFDIKHLNGKIYKFCNREGNILHNNFEKIIENLGMKRENYVGNLIIKFNVIFPNSLSNSQIKDLNKIL